MFSIIIPVHNHADHTESILKDISENSEVPSQIIIIDNGSIDNTKEVVSKFRDNLFIKLISLSKNIGVNAAWNMGMRLAAYNYISILNNDLVLNKHFFKIIRKTFEANPNCGMLCPKTSHKSFEEEDVSNYIKAVREETYSGASIVHPVPWRNGWAFTVRKKLVKHLMIPKELFNYCGDDFHYLTLKKLNYDILMMEQNRIFHYEAITGKSTKLRDRMFEDTNKWKILKEQLEL